MRLPNFRRLAKIDYPQQFQELIDKLSVSLNYGIEALYDALNNKLTFQDNFAATIATINVRVNESGTPAVTTAFKLSTSNQTVNGVLVLAVANTDDSTQYPPAAVGVSFSASTTAVTITNIKGLQANTNYSLKLLAI